MKMKGVYTHLALTDARARVRTVHDLARTLSEVFGCIPTGVHSFDQAPWYANTLYTQVRRGLPGFSREDRKSVEEELSDVLLYLVG